MIKKFRPSAFTVLELLVVMSVIGLAMSIVLVTVNSAQAKSRDSRRTQDMVQLRNALEIRATNKGGKYPEIPNGANIFFTSMGPNTVPKCPLAGTDWRSGEDSQSAEALIAADQFADDMEQYIPQLPKDPRNNKDHCYVYVAQDTDGGSSVGAFYAWQEIPVAGYEVGSSYEEGYTLGVIVGEDSDYEDILGAEDIDQVIGTGNTAGSNGGGNIGGGNMICSGYVSLCQNVVESYDCVVNNSQYCEWQYSNICEGDYYPCSWSNNPSSGDCDGGRSSYTLSCSTLSNEGNPDCRETWFDPVSSTYWSLSNPGCTVINTANSCIAKPEVTCSQYSNDQATCLALGCSYGPI